MKDIHELSKKYRPKVVMKKLLNNKSLTNFLGD